MFRFEIFNKRANETFRSGYWTMSSIITTTMTQISNKLWSELSHIAKRTFKQMK